MSKGLEDDARYQWGKELADRLPQWAETVQGVPEAVSSNPGHLALGVAGAAGIAGLTVAAPRAAARAGSALASDPSDLLVGHRDGGIFRGPLPVRLPWKDRRTGVRITGPTGSGKTTATVPFAMDDLMSGRDVFVLETHGDLGTEIRRRAEEFGAEVLLCDASEPGARYWNPLAGEDTEEVANRVAAAVSSSVFYHGYYGPIGKSFVRTFVRLAREYKEFHEGVDPSEATWGLLTDLITDTDFLHRILETTTRSETDRRQVVGAKWVSPQTRRWFDSEYLPLSERDRQQNRSNVATLFEDLADSRGAMHMLLPSSDRERLDLYEEINQPHSGPDVAGDAGSAFCRDLGRLIVLRAPVQQRGMGESEAKTIAYLGFKTLIDATLERDAPATPVKPLSIYLDEMPSLMGQAGEETQREVASWLTLVRDKNCAPHLIFQSHAVMPRILRDALDATCRVFVVFPGSSADEVEYIRKSAGIVETEVEDSRTSYSRSGKTYSEGRRSAEKSRLSFDEVKYLGRGEALFLGVRDNADELPVRIRTRRAPAPQHYRRIREKAENGPRGWGRT